MVTVIKILVEQLRPVIWLVNGNQSNGWRKFLLFREISQDYLNNWFDEKRAIQRSLWFPLAFVFGCAVYFSIPFEPGFPHWVMLAVLVGFGALLVGRFKPLAGPLTAFFALMAVWMAIGASYAAVRTHLIDARPLAQEMDKVILEGWIQKIEASTNRSRLTISVLAISGVDAHDLPETVRISQRGKMVLSTGRFVRCYVALNPPPEPDVKAGYNFHRDAFFNRLGGVGFSYGPCRAGALPDVSGVDSNLKVRINHFRQQLSAFIYKHAGERGGGLAAALLTGDRSYLSEDTQETLRSTGLAHLLAISGLHMGLAGGAFYFLFFRALSLVVPLAKRVPVQKPAALFALMSITAYLFLSGAGISAQRAYIMMAAGFIAILIDRPVLSLQTVGIAMTAVVILSPVAVVSPGFQMSFAAAAALIAAFSYVQTHRSDRLSGILGRYVAPILLTSVVAGLATTPFAIFHFGRAAPLGIPANFVVMPIFTFICVPAAVLSVIGMLFGVGEVPLYWFGQSLAFLLDIAAQFENWSGTAGHLFLEKRFTPAAFLFACFGLIFWIMSSKLFSTKATACFVTSALLWFLTPNVTLISAGQGDVAIKTDKGWVIVATKKGTLAPLQFSRMSERRCYSGCTIIAADGTNILIENGILSARRNSRVDYVLKLESDATALTEKSGRLVQIDYQIRTCRPWNTDWPACGN